MSAGVMIGRFQNAWLHPGHVKLIMKVHEHHDKTLLLLGCTAKRLSRRNPLDYYARLPLFADWPSMAIAPIYDTRSNETWSRYVDDAIYKHLRGEAVTLYSGRDGFHPYYKGKHKVVVWDWPESDTFSASEDRRRTAERQYTSKEWRAGVIWAAYHRFPAAYMTVDIGLLREDNRLLMARKADDGPSEWGLVGGFLDPGESLEQAAIRELAEETSITDTTAPRYLGSYHVRDWRYEGDRDQVTTALFSMRYISGVPIAADDIVQVEWFSRKEALEYALPHHLPLVKQIFLQEDKG